MASVYEYRGYTKHHEFLARKYGSAFLESYLQDFHAGNNTRSWTSFVVPTGVCIAYIYAHGTKAFITEYLSLSHGGKHALHTKIKACLSSGQMFNLEDDDYTCIECGCPLPTLKEPCSECGEKIFYSERSLTQSIVRLSSFLEVDVSQLKFYTERDLQDLFDEEDSLMSQELELIQHLASSKSLAEIPTITPSPIVQTVEPHVVTHEEKAKAIEAKPAPMETLQVGTPSFKVGDISVPIGEEMVSNSRLPERKCVLLPIEPQPTTAEIAEFQKQFQQGRTPTIASAIAAIGIPSAAGTVKKTATKLYKKYDAAWKRIYKKMQRDRDGIKGNRELKGLDTIIEHIVTSEENMENSLEKRAESDSIAAFKISPAQEKTKRKRRVFKVAKRNKIVRSNPVALMNSIFKLARKSGITIEVIEKKRAKTSFQWKQTKKGKFLFAQTKHEKGKFDKVDIKLNGISSKFLEQFHLKNRKLLNSDITHGWSGCIVDKTSLVGDEYKEHAGSNKFIVSGRLGRNVIDGRNEQSFDNMLATRYYSHSELFWKGYTEFFLRYKPEITDHVCTSDANVEHCGRIAGVISQILFPCGKITCKYCQVKNATMSEIDLKHRLKRIFNTLQQALLQFDSATHAVRTLQIIVDSTSVLNGNTADFATINQLIGDRRDAPYAHIHAINETLIKVGHVEGGEFERATKHLLEITRHFTKRTEAIRAGSTEHFRNKISGKAHINLSLMCDNQLDRNGNFEWGERGRHAKRFFQNYFSEIDPSLGYDQFIYRKSPNTRRKLAIGNLLVSTDFEVLRESLNGERIETQPIGRPCIALRDGNYVHSISCVTLDDGKPLLSELFTPTKNHIVVGNTGDSKFVDLPVVKESGLYIAKEGFCYLNIFLAMLVNVNEERAKEFTKLVRDKLIPQLAQWPTMQDVATACHLITAFFPETQCAELPKILVDHASKTMHVLDSYGSITTGYHILKASTVSQLMQFAQNAVDAEMKFYNVGGLLKEKSIHTCVQYLIKGVFDVKFMERIIREEPYILLMSLISPNVLLALHNSGSIERAFNHWVARDDSLSRGIAMLTILAEKVAVSDLFPQQIRHLHESAEGLQECITDGFRTQHSYALALIFLEVERNKLDADKELTDMGFKPRNLDILRLVEKNYTSQLEESWRALPLRQRLFSRLQWERRYQKVGATMLQMKESADSRGLYDVSLRSLAKTVVSKTIATTRATKIAVRQKIAKCITGSFCMLYRSFEFFVPDLMKAINLLLFFTLFLQIFQTLHKIHLDHKALKEYKANAESEKALETLETVYLSMCTDGVPPTRDEFMVHIEEKFPELLLYAKGLNEDVVVEFQGKTKEEKRIEQVIAICALVAMCFGSSRSDAIYKALSKLRYLMDTAEQEVIFQGGKTTIDMSDLSEVINLNSSTDDYLSLDDEKLLTVDFALATNQNSESVSFDCTFDKWWNQQLNQNRVVSHYRTVGPCIEFTRERAAQIAAEIAHSSNIEVLIRGAVGSGKSTGLPYHLMSKGRVLMLEPTRPLAENVCKQLQSHPFNISPTLQMRGLSAFGSSNITIMTSGFALHFFANNITKLSEYSFIIFDECHVIDASTMAFYCLLKEYKIIAKLLKVSATPPGQECEFKPQHAVSLNIEEHLSFDSFVTAQGTGSNADVVKFGNNILVYVASYNEIDQLSKKLLEKGYLVTKIDGRTMKLGSVEIVSKGTEAKKHFLVATNIIENGVTLDVDVVVDFGLKVVADLDVDNRMVRLEKKPVSFGERMQRIGRVGRVKPGHALRIGHTEKGLTEIPTIVSTEAALLCFTYGLPVVTHNVSTSLLSECTVKQAKTMMNFELSPFLTFELVKSDGSMHPIIHKLLTPYKLRNSEIFTTKLAIPSAGICRWLTAENYNRLGVRNDLPPNTRVPFYVRGTSDRLYEDIWNCVTEHAQDACFGKISSASACKVAYTLQTDVFSLPKTLAILDGLIQEEFTKEAHFNSLNSNICSSSSFTLSGIANMVRRHYQKDHSTHNLEVLQRAKAQLVEFKNLHVDANAIDVIRNFPYLECVQFQSGKQIADKLHLKGKWNCKGIVKDIIVLGGVAVGGSVMLYKKFTGNMKTQVEFQSYTKRQRQKIKFRAARDVRMAREVFGDDEVIGEYFGEAYTKKGKKSGRKHGTGDKKHKFVNMYNFDPTEYNLVRFVDPLTGHTLDESPNTDVSLVQDELGNIREKFLTVDKIDSQSMRTNTHIVAYFTKRYGDHALKVDLYPHNPLQVGEKSNTIAGFPEREGELRQKGQAVKVPIHSVPAYYDAGKEVEDVNLEVDLEGKSMCRGLRDYTGISNAICQLTNMQENKQEMMYGVGFGSYILTPKHLFRAGTDANLLIKTQHGMFNIDRMSEIEVIPIPGRDLLIVRMPRDFPPFPVRLQFRPPSKDDRVCLVGAVFQEQSVRGCISETSSIFKVDHSSFWKHKISTKHGHCGLPLVDVGDGHIIGIHSLTATNNEVNYFTALPDNFKDEYLSKPDHTLWKSHWSFNANSIAWGGLTLKKDEPKGLFKLSKMISDLDETEVEYQGEKRKWVLEAIHGNLKAVAQCPSNLVTKHVVKQKCPYFIEYLQAHEEPYKFFQPLMDAYGKSVLNRQAFIKDIMKYSEIIQIGKVNIPRFEQAVFDTQMILNDLDFGECEYVTDANAIFSNLNMNAAVGALYGGKKKDYFAEYDTFKRDQIVQQSCERLFHGKMGVWNGSLKAELRAKEKIEAGKTRTFTAAPLDTLLAGKVCVDDFNNTFYSLNLQGPWTVGMTKFYGGWNRLMSKLPDGWIYCDADGSRFDSSLTPLLINAVLNTRLMFMEPWFIGSQMLKNLYTEIVYTPIASPDGTILKKFRGNNSGQPSTVVDNSLMVIIAVCYALRKHGIDYNTAKDKFVFFVNGDDLLIAIEPTLEATLDTFSQSFSELGLQYEFTSRHKQKENLWFMSHKAVSTGSIYIPKLEEERIVSILQWDRSAEKVHRLEAICAAMIEAWGYPELLQHIRKFYWWIIHHEDFETTKEDSGFPYLTERALKYLYTEEADANEIAQYLENSEWMGEVTDFCEVEFQSGTPGDGDPKIPKDTEPKILNAGSSNPTSGQPKPRNEQQPLSRQNSSERNAQGDAQNKGKAVNQPIIEHPDDNPPKLLLDAQKPPPDPMDESQTQRDMQQRNRDNDINVGAAGASGIYKVPRIKSYKGRMRKPIVRGANALNLEHLLTYKPDQVNISNTRASQEQFEHWHMKVQEAYGVDDKEMQILMNGLMIWCIENGTSHSLTGHWSMMDGDDQITYSLKPIVENAQPTLRQIMSHFSDVAEAYIEERNTKERYMPRYGSIRNLRDYGLARVAFDFYEVTSQTSEKAREAHFQMKAAAIGRTHQRLFGMDGRVSSATEDTERHTVDDHDVTTQALFGVRK